MRTASRCRTRCLRWKSSCSTSACDPQDGPHPRCMKNGARGPIFVGGRAAVTMRGYKRPSLLPLADSTSQWGLAPTAGQCRKHFGSVPASLLHSGAHTLQVQFGTGRPLTAMAPLIASQARGDNIAGRVSAAILTSLQVLGRAPKQSRLFRRQIVADAECRWIVQPQGQITVVAAAGLTGEGSSAGTHKACGHDWLQELWNRCRPTGIGGNRRRSSSRPRRAARIGSARENYALASRWGQAPHRWRPSGERLRPAKALQRASRPGR